MSLRTPWLGLDAPQVELLPIPQIVAPGKNKTGWWVELLTDKLKETTNPAKAVFYAYAYYQKGKKIYDPTFGMKTYDEVTPAAKKDTIAELDGVYYSYGGTAKEEYHYNKGMALYCRHYLKDSLLYETVDYHDTYKNVPFSSAYTLYKIEDGTILQKAYIYWKDDKFNSAIIINKL